MNDIRQQLYKEIFIELPKLAVTQDWAVTLNHCIGRIVYDSVMGCKWSEQVKSPFYKNVDESKIKEALEVCDRLKDDSDIDIKYCTDCYTANTLCFDIEDLRKIVKEWDKYS